MMHNRNRCYTKHSLVRVIFSHKSVLSMKNIKIKNLIMPWFMICARRKMERSTEGSQLAKNKNFLTSMLLMTLWAQSYKSQDQMDHMSRDLSQLRQKRCGENLTKPTIIIRGEILQLAQISCSFVVQTTHLHKIPPQVSVFRNRCSSTNKT